MKRSRTTLCIAETISDCNQAVLEAVKKQRAYKILAISLEVKEFCDQNEVPYVYIWDEIDMDVLLHKAYNSSVKRARAWVKHFSYSKYNDLDTAIEHSLSHRVLQHTTACELLAKQISQKLAPQFLAIWLPKPRLSFLSIYASHHQTSQSNSILCEMIYDRLASHTLTVSWSKAYRKLISLHNNTIPWIRLFAVFLHGLVEIPIARTIKKTRPLKSQVNITDSEIVFAGWGRDLHRMIDIAKIENQLTKINLRAIHTIWRPGKLSIPRSAQKNSIYIKEQIGKGTSLGPRASMFSLFSYVRHNFILLFRILPSRISLAARYHHNATISQVVYHLVFAYRDALLSYRLTQDMLEKISSRVYVGCDSGSVGARAELLAAKKRGMITVGTPHGFLHHWLHSNFEIADYGAVYSHDAKRLIEFEKAKPSKYIWVIGHTYHGYKKKSKHDPPLNITLATRSWGGYWSNIASHHQKYGTALHSLLQFITNNTEATISIKSHPNGDLHRYYDLLAKKYGSQVRHIPTGWSPEDFSDNTDILVCLGDVPSLFVYALHSDTPIIFQTSTFSATQRTLNYKYSDAGVVVNSSLDRNKMLEKMLNKKSLLQDLVKDQVDSVRKQHEKNPERLLVQKIHEIVT